jgi:hypothetical protein
MVNDRKKIWEVAKKLNEIKQKSGKYLQSGSPGRKVFHKHSITKTYYHGGKDNFNL